jgi:hypothetical protein
MGTERRRRSPGHFQIEGREQDLLIQQRPFDVVGEIIVLLCVVEQLPPPQTTSHRRGLHPDDLRPLAVMLGSRSENIGIFCHARATLAKVKGCKIAASDLAESVHARKAISASPVAA